jgi:signal transduction histidine kinase
VPLVTDLGSDLPDVPGDRVQLQQVVLNLLLNAVEAMHDRPPGERQLVVRTSTAGDGIEVAVVDRGSGIRPEHLERLFDPFFSTKATGLGMGLRICSAIIHAHGGRIWATNNPDVGATLRFTLPLVGAGAA